MQNGVASEIDIAICLGMLPKNRTFQWRSIYFIELVLEISRRDVLTHSTLQRSQLLVEQLGFNPENEIIHTLAFLGATTLWTQVLCAFSAGVLVRLPMNYFLFFEFSAQNWFPVCTMFWSDLSRKMIDTLREDSSYSRSRRVVVVSFSLVPFWCPEDVNLYPLKFNQIQFRMCPVTGGMTIITTLSVSGDIFVQREHAEVPFELVYGSPACIPLKKFSAHGRSWSVVYVQNFHRSDLLRGLAKWPVPGDKLPCIACTCEGKLCLVRS